MSFLLNLQVPILSTSDNPTSILASDSSLPLIQPLVTPPSPSIPTKTNTNFLGTSTTISAEPTISTELIPSNSISNPILFDSPSPIPPSSILRRSTRPHNPLPYLSEYSCKSVSTKSGSGLPYNISNCLDYSHLGPTFHSFVMAVTTTPSKPVSFN